MSSMRQGRVGSRAGEVLRGVTALAAIAVLVVGIPVFALPQLGWPLPHGMPTPGGVFDALMRRGMNLSVLLRAAAAVLWITWAALSGCVLAEALAWARRREPRPVPGLGGFQRLAFNLVAMAVLVMPALPRLAVAPALAAPLVAARPSVPAVVASPAASPSPDAEPATAAPTAASPKSYVVQRYDCLWDVAERHLGDPLRWTEIRDLTAGVTQPDGARLGDPNLIYPGWTLLLPPDATGLGDVASPAVPTPPPVPSAPASAPAASSAKAPAMAPAEPPATAATPTAEAPAAAPNAAAPAPQLSASAAPPPGPPPSAVPESTPTPPRPPGSPPQVSPPAPASKPGKMAPSLPVSKAAAAGVGLSGLLGGVFVWRMRREALVAHRRRRRGRQLVQPDPVTEPVERRVRAIAAEETVHWVDATLRYASAVLADADGGGVEAIMCVRAGQLGMEVVVDPARPPVGRFDSSDGGHTWTLDGDMELAELADLAWGQVLAPALCSVGTSADGPVLVDLEQMGVLAVEGDGARVEGFLAGAALELASAPWSDDTAVYLLGGDENLAKRDMVEVVTDAGAFVAGLDDLTSLIDESDLGPAPSTLAARVAPGNAEGWFPTVVVAHPGTDGDVLADLVARARPRRSGLVVVAPGPLAAATWRLVLGADGLAVLEPLGIELDARVDAEVVTALAGRLAVRTEHIEIAPVVELVPETPAPEAEEVEVGNETEPMEGEVRVLGPVEVTWATTDVATAPDRASLLSALVAYLGTHDDHPVPGPRLQEALWPLGDDLGDVASGAAKEGTLRATVSRARRALGKDSLGRNHLPSARGGMYALGPRFGCDWSRFCTYVATARRGSSAEAIECYREALSLVRGRPFQDAPVAYFAWADDTPLVSDIEIAVAAAAEELGTLALEAGKPELAAWAARQGLRVVPVREDLYRVRMQAAFDAGDPDGIEQAHTEAKRAARVIAESLQDETERLYQRLKRACRSRGAKATVSSGTGGA